MGRIPSVNGKVGRLPFYRPPHVGEANNSLLSCPWPVFGAKLNYARPFLAVTAAASRKSSRSSTC
jgi:hypothetical protein